MPFVSHCREIVVRRWMQILHLDDQLVKNLSAFLLSKCRLAMKKVCCLVRTVIWLHFILYQPTLSGLSSLSLAYGSVHKRLSTLRASFFISETQCNRSPAFSSAVNLSSKFQSYIFLSCIFQSCKFQSCIFQPCSFVLHFPVHIFHCSTFVLHFPVLHFQSTH